MSKKRKMSKTTISDNQFERIKIQEDLETLLNALTNEPVPDDTPGEETRRVKIYDFLRPDRFSRDQIMALQMIHEQFSMLASQSLSKRLGMRTEIYVASVDQISFQEFIRCVPLNSSCAVVALKPLPGSIVIQIDPSIAQSIIASKTGYAFNASASPNQLTAIDSAILEEEYTMFAKWIATAWHPVASLYPRIEYLENMPEKLCNIPSCDMVLLITCEFHIGDTEAMMNLCFPYRTIEPLIEHLSARNVMGTVPTQKKRLNTNFNLSTHISVHGGSMYWKEINALREGSILPIANAHGTNAQADIIIGGVQVSPVSISLEARECCIRLDSKILATGKTASTKPKFITWYSFIHFTRQLIQRVLSLQVNTTLTDYLSTLDFGVLKRIVSEESLWVSSLIISRLDETTKIKVLKSLKKYRYRLISKKLREQSSVSKNTEIAVLRGLRYRA